MEERTGVSPFTTATSGATVTMTYGGAIQRLMAQCQATDVEAAAAVELAHAIKRRIDDNGGTLIIAGPATLKHPGYETLAKAIPHDRGRATAAIDPTSAGFALDALASPGHRLVHYDDTVGGEEQCIWAMVPHPVGQTAATTSDERVLAPVG